MKKKEPKVCIVILNYNGYEDTKNCIFSLENSLYKNFNIVVVDNASPDGSGEKLKSEFPKIKFIFSKQNKGYACGMNIGAAYAIELGADYILLSNNDIIFTNNFLNPLIDIITSKDSIGIVSPKVLYLHDKSTIYCAGADFRLLYCGGYNPFQGKTSQQFANQLRPISLAEGSCLLIKREVFEKVGFISEKYFMYFEDLDFSDEVKKYYEIFYVPGSIVYHKAGAGVYWNSYSSLYYYYYTRNRLVYFSKYNLIYKIYAVVFTVLNSLAKTAVLLITYITVKEGRVRLINSIKSLWKGTWAGMKIIYTFKGIKT